ncbi:MAG TPA: putative baseplate assembly protein [Pyrinomonadaceae bacterium]|nr:putative baseplate assembly protein [Pyrinomonadaceae bacterium]
MSNTCVGGYCSCGCCEGIEELTPATVANRPGLDALSYRAGTHASFLETMKARLSAHCLDPGAEGCKDSPRPLGRLTTRAGDDASVAMLDAWATVADVLTFYQERIANEGYLRTATERRSVMELARLIGYELRNGVASSVHLAFTLEQGTEQEIPAGTRAQSVPGPGELLQSFETSEPLPARAVWNTLRPRMSRPQRLLQQLQQTELQPYLYLKGTATNLSVNDALLVVVGVARTMYRVLEVNADTASDRTLVKVSEWVSGGAGAPVFQSSAESALEQLNVTVDNALAQLGTNINPALKTAIATDELLKALKDALKDKKAGEILRLLEEEVLPELHKLVAQPAVQRSANLRTWLDGIIEELEDVTGSLTASAPDETIDLGELFDEPGVFELPTSLGGEDDDSNGNGSGDGNGNGNPDEEKAVPTIELVSALSEQLLKPVSKHPANSADLPRSIEKSFYATSDTASRLMTAFQPSLKENIYRALGNAPVTQATPVEVYALRTKAKLFGSTAIPQTSVVTTDSSANNNLTRTTTTNYIEWTPANDEQNNFLFLDNAYDKIQPDAGPSHRSYVAVLRSDRTAPTIFTSLDANVRARTAYGISGDTTLITLDAEWWRPRGAGGTGGGATQIPDPSPPFPAVRGTLVFAQSELLEVAEEPVTEDICNERIVLDGVYDGMEPGRWLIITGERVDVGFQPEPPPAAARAVVVEDDFARREQPVPAEGFSTSGTSTLPEEPPIPVPAIPATELVMLGGVEIGYDPTLAGDRMHTTIVLAEKLAYCYKRDTVTIYGNVVHATHGETREEVLGSGDAGRPLQSFTLRQWPLTFVSAVTPSGVESTLDVRVGDVRWRETDSLAGLAPKDHKYVTRTDDEAKTTVVFGNGERGARLPTGVENVKAVYRTGIGKPGNVNAGQITLLSPKPLYVSKVTNPLAATGGADREDRDDARRNAPLAVMSLDRLVSVRDYEDFARTFAGVGKASAARLTDGQGTVVHLTVAGADDIPIAPESDLFTNLRLALLKFGDPFQPLAIEVRALRLLVISAGVRLDPDYLWESVEPKIRTALLDRFSFDRRELGQDAYLSEVIGAIQSVPGVVYVDVDTFDALDEDISSASLELIGARTKPRQRIPVRLAQPDYYAEGPNIKPAQLALLSASVPETLILKELKV